MTNLYLFSLVSGGLTLLASTPPSGARNIREALRSRRYWTLVLSFFGLTGLALSNLCVGASSCCGSIPLAIVVALGLALFTVLLLSKLSAGDTSTAADERDFVGKTGRVLVPFAAGQLGKIRITLRSGVVDAVAKTDEAEAFAVGDEALIIHMDGAHVVVIRPAKHP